MSKLVYDRSKKIGLSPGVLIHIGAQKVKAVRLHLIDYGPDQFEERELISPAECSAFAERDTVTWVNIEGLHDTSMVGQLGNVFHIHDLVLEDILNTAQRPKFEDHDDFLYIVLRMLSSKPGNGRIESDQVSLVFGRGTVLTFQERPGDVLDGLRDRIREKKGRIRSMGADYLAYAILDVIVDQYYVVLERIGNQLENLEEMLVQSPGTDTLHSLHMAKRDLIDVRKATWPLRELVAQFRHSESDLLGSDIRRFSQDLYDHAVQILDTVETLRDVTAGLQDIYLSSVSNRMNEVMKTLTVMATIFIPLTFIAGIYGMNFDNMPELHWGWGYCGIWGVMVTVAAGMVVYFRRKNWF